MNSEVNGYDVKPMKGVGMIGGGPPHKPLIA